MSRILASFLILTSLIVVTPAALAQEQDLGDINQKPMVASPRLESPRIMKRSWTMTETPAQQENPAPAQKPIDSSAKIMAKERFSPEQATYGINAGLKKKNDGDKETAPEQISVPKGDFSELRQMDTATVDQVIDPLRIQLKDKRIIQLAGLDIPDFNLEDPGDVSVAAMMFLKNYLEGKQVRLFQTKDNTKGRTNRLGYVLSHLVRTEDDTWVQGGLLSAGLARVQPSERNPEMAAQMTKIEEDARAAKRGLWADAQYNIHSADEASSVIGQWGIVEGRIHAVGTSNNMVYLNFGGDWRNDFTIGLTVPVRREMEKAGVNTPSLSGRKVRVRGWIREYNGPYVELLHPAWLEILPEDPQSPNLTPQ